MSLISISFCPICNHNKFSQFLNCKDYTTSQETFILKKCDSCLFLLTSPRPDQDSSGGYYQSETYISHTGGGKSLIDRIYIIARKITLRWKRRVIQNNSTGNTILDVGCGTGEFLMEMKLKGWNSSGVEPSSIARPSAEKKIEKKIYKQLTEIKDTNFDVISLWHVLEHVYDLNETLQKLHLLLKESGTIFIAVPNHEAYDAQHYQAHWAGYDVPRHLWHFTKENMKTILQQNGFNLIKILPMHLDSFYVSLLSESYKFPRGAKTRNIINAILVGLKSNLKAKKNLNFSSLIYIATR
jgi:2-polyprenyl-3-methyl-5-hydroxy-6-metoxy-1,4-benzoquinol methylase